MDNKILDLIEQKDFMLLKEELTKVRSIDIAEEIGRASCRERV